MIRLVSSLLDMYIQCEELLKMWTPMSNRMVEEKMTFFNSLSSAA